MAPWGGDDLLAPTLEIAERCNVVLELDRIHLPRFDEAEGDSFGMLRRLCEAGMTRALRAIARRSSSANRLEFELQTIREMGFADYFLIVWDFVRFAKANGSPSARAAARPPARSSPTRCASPTSIRCATTCSSSAS